MHIPVTIISELLQLIRLYSQRRETLNLHDDHSNDNNYPAQTTGRPFAIAHIA
jgi:hypothetical protein